MNKLGRNITFSALLLAMGLILPWLFHVLGNWGAVFLPMHIGMVLAGYLLPPGWCLALGIITPLASSVLTGMPIFPLNYLMVIELSVLGVSLALLRQRMGSSRLGLIFAMLLSRAARIGGTWIMAQLLGFTFDLMGIVGLIFVMGLPGILIQILWLPSMSQRIGMILQAK
ncbi:ECF transporter S component [Clostridia bacterium]|nr:ECF transporter S component [Clostridia bacterium]